MVERAPPAASKRKRVIDDDESSVDYNAYWTEGRLTMWQIDYFENHFTTWADWDMNHIDQSDQLLSSADWDMDPIEHHSEQ